MFRFVYAMEADEPWDGALAAEGFVGVESASTLSAGVVRIGQRRPPFELPYPDYVIWPTGGGAASVEGKSLRAAAEKLKESRIFVENGGAFVTAHDLWTLLEAAHHPRVMLALDIDAAREAGQTAAVLVPTLNLRIGLVRVRQHHDDIANYARRLAGIGFEGYVVIDPPPGANRVAEAQAIAAVFRAVFPAKPVKKPATGKVISAKAASRAGYPRPGND